MTCYRLIGGTAMDAFSRQQALLRGKPDPLLPAATIGAGRYPPVLLALIDAALCVAPDDRPQDVAEILTRLNDDGAPTAIAQPRDTEPRDSLALLDESQNPVAPSDPDATLHLTPPADPEPAAATPAGAPPRNGRKWLVPAAAALAVVVIGGIAAVVTRSHPTGNPLLAGMTAETSRDYAQAMRWYRAAADQGDQNAPYQIGALYARGLGVAKDCAAAKSWFDKAEAGGGGGTKRWLPWYEECPAR